MTVNVFKSGKFGFKSGCDSNHITVGRNKYRRIIHPDLNITFPDLKSVARTTATSLICICGCKILVDLKPAHADDNPNPNQKKQRLCVKCVGCYIWVSYLCLSFHILFLPRFFFTEYLLLDHNHLSGSIPLGIGQLNTKIISFKHNCLKGDLLQISCDREWCSFIHLDDYIQNKHSTNTCVF